MINTPLEILFYLAAIAMIVAGILFWSRYYFRKKNGLPPLNWRVQLQIRELDKLIDELQGKARRSPSTWYSPHGGTRFVISRTSTEYAGRIDEIVLTDVREIGRHMPTRPKVFHVLYALGSVQCADRATGETLWVDETRLRRLISQLREARL